MLLWQTYVAGKNKTYLRLHVQSSTLRWNKGMLDIVGTVYHLVIHMQSNKIQEVF